MRRPALALVTIAAALWAGGNVAMVVVAARTFSLLRDERPGWVAVAPETVAGGVVGSALAAWSVVAWSLCLAVVLGLAVLAARRRALPATLALATLVGCVASHWVYAGTLATAHALGEARRAGDPAAVEPWQAAHTASVRWMGIETGLAFGVAVGAAIALVRRTRDTVSATSAHARDS